MIYRIELSHAARKALRSVPTPQRRRILKAIGDLATTPRPHGSKKIVGGMGELRLRVGTYRIIYDVEDEALRILIIAIGPRKDIYR